MHHFFAKPSLMRFNHFLYRCHQFSPELFQALLCARLYSSSDLFVGTAFGTRGPANNATERLAMTRTMRNR